MGSSYGETVLDFDLNFLHPTPNSTVIQNKLDKQRRAILVVKKKVVATDSLIKKYFTKKDELDLTEKNLFASKEECKQICLDYRKSLDACSVLENDMLILQNTNKELVEKCFQVENQLAASKSHTHQLQLLVKEYETSLESLKVENNLAKSNVKDSQKKLFSVQKESKVLIKHITLAKDIIFKKKKLRSSHKVILQKYDKYHSSNDEDNGSSEEDDFDDVPLSPFSEDDNKIPLLIESPDTTTEIKTLNTITHMNTIRSNKNQDIEYTNDLGSVDTGRGSSLALSDSDKYSHSTDYYINDSPLSDVSISNAETKKFVDVGTSPMLAYNTTHTATSPIEFDKCRYNTADVGQNTDPCCVGLPDQFFNSNKIVMVDHAISPIQLFETTEKSVSPISSLHANVATSPIQFIECIQNNVHQETQQLKDCLELNSSNHLSNEIDGEIEVILSKMRMDHNLVTPIPLTPVKLQCVTNVDVSIQNKHIDHTPSLNCHDAAIVREENKKLQASILELAKEINDIKNILKTPFRPVYDNEDHHIINNNSLTQCSEIDIIHTNVIRNPNLKHCNDAEPTTINNQKTPISNVSNELDIVETNSILQVPPTVCHSRSSPDIEIEDHNMNNFSGIVESAAECRTSAKYVEDENVVITPNNFEIRSPIVICEKIDLSSICTKANNTEIEQGHHNARRKTAKVKKLTRLGKLKRGILPKYKIKADYLQSSKRSCLKLTKTIMPKKIKTNTDHDSSSATLNDKCIYEKAIKVMAALKNQRISETHGKIHTKRKENIEVSNKNDNVLNNEKNKPVDQNIELIVNDKDKFINESSILKISVTTRSQSKQNNPIDNINSVPDEYHELDNISLSQLIKRNNEISTNIPILQESRKRSRSSEDTQEIPSKRLLRSSINQEEANAIDKIVLKSGTKLSNNIDMNALAPIEINLDLPNRLRMSRKSLNSVETDNPCNNAHLKETEKYVCNSTTSTNSTPKQSVLCVMIEKYGVKSVKYCVNKFSESTIDSIAKKIEEGIVSIIELPYNETKEAMNKLVTVIETWNIKHFLSGLMKYLHDPGRRRELYKTLELPPAPPMTKQEQVLLYIVDQLNNCWPTINVVDKILLSIEYSLFSLNHTPNFEVIESMSHFYAVLCRYYKLKSRLRLFMLDAMYCIQYKSIALIKQCLDVWMHILPLAHMGIAKHPLVTCLVYLLHFYKCEDRLNKVRDMRYILSRNYFYKFADWNETQILDMFKNSIKDIKSTNKGNLVEKKMLRLALIILAKRQGPKWCQNNIIKKVIDPVIENEKMQDSVREFCVSLIGPLMKPYPIDMKVHCEVVMNRLFNMLQNNPSHNMTEAIMTSLIYMNRHNQHRVIEAMITWCPQKLSYEFEEILRGFVRSKPIKAWKTTLSKIPL